MKNVRIKVRENCDGNGWDYAVWDEKRKTSLECGGWYYSKARAIRAAKAMAKKIGVPYDPKIAKQHGC